MKKMILTLHNVQKINHRELPIHGAMVKMTLHNGETKNIVVMGDSGAGKSETIEKIKAKGIEILDVTLHVGLGTFRPVKVDNVLEHHMHSEYYMIEPEVADKLNQAKANGQRIIAVGTTSTRTLEANMQKYGKFTATHENTDIFIYPGYQYQAIDCLITNFHLPKSTLLMLISAFATKEFIFKAYHEAIENKYRFFSFGDSMFIM